MGPDHPIRPVFDAADRELAGKLFETVRRVSADRVGVTRPSYGEAESRAMEAIDNAAREAGLATRRDAAANLVAELPGTPAGQPACWIGSHLDSVPEGGNFDGLAGVVAGLLCLIKLRRQGAA